MRSILALIVLCACDQVFGIGNTHSNKPQSVDAQFFDAPPDAPFTCPALGTPPHFQRELRQIDADGCGQYTRSDTLAIAMCGTGQVAQGPVDGPLATIPDIDLTGYGPTAATLSPEGDQLYLSGYDINTFTSQPYRVYDRQGDGTWMRDVDLPMPLGATITTVTRGPDRHILYFSRGAAGANVEEWSNGSGSWQQIAVHSGAELGVSAVFSVWFAADGLRAILQADVGTSSTPLMLYTDRATMPGAFRTAVPLTGVPLVDDAFMTPDCGRIYMSGLNAVFYEQQQ